MKAAQDELFAVIGEGAQLLKTLDENSSGFFESLNRLREILSMLGESAAPAPVAVRFSLEDKAASAASLRGYVETGLGALPDELAVFEAETVAELAQLAGDHAVMRAANNWARDNPVIVHSTSLDKTKLAAFAHFESRGLAHNLNGAKLKDALQDAETLLAQPLEDNAAYREARAHYDQLSAARQARFKEINAALLDLDLTADKRSALRSEREALYEETATADAWEAVKATHAAFNEERVASHRALFEGNGKDILSKVFEASPVTEDAARAWASEQIIDDNAKAKLKRLGYKPDDVIRDMAEFYRLTGGKASAIRISAGGRRANAVGVTERLGEKVINLGTRFDKTVLFHELAHHLENDPIAKAASNGFLLKRRESETVYSLRSLTGNKGYDKGEGAYKDSFMDPYVGKVYRGGITEVFSMGVQYLANPVDAAIFAGKDPEMFNLITGYLGMATTPAMHAKLNMHASAIDELQTKRATEEQQYEKALAFVAAKALIIADDWFATLDRDSQLAEMLFAYVLTKDKKRSPLYVGSNGEYKVFSGSFRNKNTKRWGKGYLVVHAVDSDNMVPDSEVLNANIEDVQAMIGLTRLNGVTLSKTYYSYFWDGWNAQNRKKNLIETVGSENVQ
ncbi:hypothetical protein PQR05_29410 [Paraburkholderia sediminicola]|uniref:hypothetical protein n=1 Tax=Paraburkholderia sediminicola TaxID=458836 RepID=UPI0038B766D6